MTLVEKYDYLERYDKKNIQEYISLFMEDIDNDCVLLEKLFSFFEYASKIEGDIYLRELSFIANKYYDKCPYYNKKYEFVYINLVYSYSAGEYSQLFFLVSKIDNMETPPSLILSSYIMQINILNYLNMMNEAENCINYILGSYFCKEANPYLQCVFYINSLSIFIKKENISRVNEFWSLINSILNNHDSIFKIKDCEIVVKTIKFYYDIFFTKKGVLQLSLRKLATEFKEFILSTRITSITINEDSDLYIDILHLLDDTLDSLSKYEICIKLISEKQYIKRDLINFYNYLLESENVYYFNNPTDIKNHMDALYFYYKDKQQGYIQTLKETLRLNMVEQKLSILESKYNVDILTECYNKNFLFEKENEILNYGCLIYFDLDGFKKVNDTYGHNVGDIYLKEFSKILFNGFSKEENLLFRFGGDEFIVISRNSLNEVIRIIQNMSFVGTQTKILNNDNITIRFSCGIYEVKNRITVKEAMLYADAAMYNCKAKRQLNKNINYYIYKEDLQ